MKYVLGICLILSGLVPFAAALAQDGRSMPFPVRSYGPIQIPTGSAAAAANGYAGGSALTGSAAAASNNNAFAFSSLQSPQISSSEVLQVNLPEMKIHTDSGIRALNISFETAIGDISEDWLQKRLIELRTPYNNLEFVVSGSDVKSKAYLELIEYVKMLRKDRERLVIANQAIEIPSELNYEKQKRSITIVNMAVAGINTFVGLYFGTDIPVAYQVAAALQASIMSGVWTYNSERYYHWVTRKGLLPAQDALKSGHIETFFKRWAASALYLYLLKTGASYLPFYSGVTNPAGILMDSAFVGLQGLFSRFFYQRAIDHVVDQKVDSDPNLRDKMELWRMRTTLTMGLVFGVVEQLAVFHVPGASYVLMGLGAGGLVLYRYVTNLKTRDILRALFRFKNPATAFRVAGTCAYLFF